jgi:cytoskeletal protein CcmA (bactofilin family)
MTMGTDKLEKAITFLGKDTQFEGRLRFEGTLRIDGSMQGEITSKGNLVIGEDALVKGDMHVSYAVISGEVHGDIIADQRVDLRAPAKVFGSISAPAVVMDAGVIFEGHTRMYRARDAIETPETPVIGSDEYRGEPPGGLTAVYGIVTDKTTGVPVKKCRIRCRGHEKKETETNSSGYYEIIHLKEGKWRLKVTAKGYRSEIAEVGIDGEGTHRLDFGLREKSRPLLFGRGRKKETP